MFGNTRNNIVAFVLSTIILGVVVNLMNPASSLDFSKYFSVTFGYINFNNVTSLITSIMKWILPQFILMFFWGDYLEYRLINHLNYILTRTNKVAKYLKMVYLELLAVTILACVILYIVTIAVAGVTLGQLSFSFSILENMFTYMIYLYMMLLLVNMISIFVKAIYGVFIVMGIQTIFLVITKYILDGVVSENLYRLLPTSSVLFYYNSGSLAVALLLMLLVFAIYLFNVIFLRKKEVL